MKFSINFLLGLTLLIALGLATVRLGRLVVIREIECFLEKPFEKHFATDAPLPSLHAIKKEIRDCEKILSGFEIPLNSTRFREDISRADAEPALYFSDHMVQQLCLAINTNNLDEMKRLLDKGVNVNARGDGGITPLIWAFAQRKPDAFRLLLRNKADPDLRLSDRIHMLGRYSNTDDNIFTFIASFSFGSHQFLRDAIPFCKNVNQRNENGDTLLMTFVKYGYYELRFDSTSFTAFIAAGADLNSQNDSGETVCTLTASHPEKCLWFLENGADPTLRRYDGKDLLDLISPSFENGRVDPEYQKLRDKILEFKRLAGTSSAQPEVATEMPNEK